MENREVFVPLMSWLIGGSRIGGSYNIYTASLGTDPYKGAIGQRIFNYRIGIEKDEEETELIVVSVYYGMLSYENQYEDEVKRSFFKLSEEGLKELKDYLQQEADTYFAQE